MENLTIQNSENLLAAKASTQPLNDFPVDQLPLGLRDSLSGVVPEARVPALFSALPHCRSLRRRSEGEVLRRQRDSDGTHVYHHRRAGIR